MRTVKDNFSKVRRIYLCSNSRLKMPFEKAIQQIRAVDSDAEIINISDYQRKEIKSLVANYDEVVLISDNLKSMNTAGVTFLLLEQNYSTGYFFDMIDKIMYLSEDDAVFFEKYYYLQNSIQMEKNHVNDGINSFYLSSGSFHTLYACVYDLDNINENTKNNLFSFIEDPREVYLIPCREVSDLTVLANFENYDK